RLWEREKKTVVMVTHDVDEALLLADRVVMMTSGPAATVGAVLAVPLPRPRRRTAIVDDPSYYRAREQLLEVLDSAAAIPSAPADDTLPASSVECAAAMSTPRAPLAIKIAV